jgi:hypothetical protein
MSYKLIKEHGGDAIARCLYCVIAVAIAHAFPKATATVGKTKVVVSWPGDESKSPVRYDLDYDGQALVRHFDDLQDREGSVEKDDYIITLRAPKPKPGPPALSQRVSTINLDVVREKQERRMKRSKRFAVRNLSGILYTKLGE